MGKHDKKNDKKRKSKKKRILIVLTVFVIVIGLILGIPYYMFSSQFSKVKVSTLPTDNKGLGIDENIYNEKNKKLQEEYVNILLLGVDARDPNESSRSDSMMIATIDKKHNKIKLSSLMRDMIVTTTGHGPMEGLNQDRLNHTYQYGGAALTLKTINENFKMNMKDFVEVDFFGLEKIIDKIGGVEINVSAAELPYVNSYQNEVAHIEKVKPILLAKPGLQVLNGKQAVGYARIRYVGDMDFQRTERQRTVLTKVFEKMSKMNILDLNNAIGEILPDVNTSLDKGDILGLSKDILLNKMSKVDQLRLPIDGHNGTIYVRNTYFLGWDKEPNLEALHKFIYEEDYDPNSVK
jgi:LCP family protein required for cell wall assembly